MSNNLIAVAMSGGVDSSAVAAMMKHRGDNIVGLTMQLWIQRRLPDTKITYVKQVSDPRDYRVRFAKIRAVLGFELEHNVESGIDEILAAIRDGVITDTHNARYAN